MPEFDSNKLIICIGVTLVIAGFCLFSILPKVSSYLDEQDIKNCPHGENTRRSKCDDCEDLEAM